METGDEQVSCSPDEFFDGVEDKCIPCANVCTKGMSLTFCKNNCPEYYKKLTTETYRSIAAFVETPRTTFVDNLFSTSTATESSSNYNTSHYPNSPTLHVIPLTTLLALIAAVIAICIAIVAFVLICKARRRQTCGGRLNSDTENPLLHRTESGSLGTSNLSTSSTSNGGCCILNAQNELPSKVPVVFNRSRSVPPDVTRDANVTRDAKAGNDERKLETKHTPSCSSSSSSSSSTTATTTIKS